MRKKFKFFCMFFIKRIIGFFKKNTIEDENIKKILEALEEKSFFHYQNFYSSHKLSYKSSIRKILKYISKIFFYKHHYLLAHEDEKYFINNNDVIHCVGKKGDLFFINTEAWHCGRPLEKNGYREVIWNYIYSESLRDWTNQLFFKK